MPSEPRIEDVRYGDGHVSFTVVFDVAEDVRRMVEYVNQYPIVRRVFLERVGASLDGSALAGPSPEDGGAQSAQHDKPG